MKTAVEWLKEIYDSCNTYEKFISNSDWEEANKMFEEQIMQAFANGKINGDKNWAHRYYKQTFK
jgi:ABC-type glycerol-3-phosphate transport system substrate-binding protein